MCSFKHKHFGIKICFLMLLNFDKTDVQAKNRQVNILFPPTYGLKNIFSLPAEMCIKKHPICETAPFCPFVDSRRALKIQHMHYTRQLHIYAAKHIKNG